MLGTYVEVNIQADVSSKKIVELSRLAYEEVEAIERSMSFHNPNSELSFLNNNAHKQAVRLSTDMTYVLSHALQLSRETQGDFDVCIGSDLVRQGLLPNNDSVKKSHTSSTTLNHGSWRDVQFEDDQIYFHKPLTIDLGGIAKGFAVDKACKVFKSEEFVTVNAGGDLRTTHKEKSSVFLRHPNISTNKAFQLPMLNEAVATSAGYYSESNHSVFSTKTRRPITEMRSVSVFAPSCMLADALTKVALVHKNAAHVLNRYSAVSVFIDDDGNISEY